MYAVKSKVWSFRNLCHLTMIGEERIIQQASPVTKGQYVTKTADGGVFALLMTGTDDSSVVAVETKQEHGERRAIQQELVRTLIDEKRAEFASLDLDSGHLNAEAKRLNAEIDHASRTIVASQEQIETYERRRQALIALNANRQSRLIFVEEQSGRLNLLQEYDNTDFARLETLVQASRVFTLCRKDLFKKII